VSNWFETLTGVRARAQNLEALPVARGPVWSSKQVKQLLMGKRVVTVMTGRGRFQAAGSLPLTVESCLMELVATVASTQAALGVRFEKETAL
jgi:hypothetical protein